MTDWPNSGTKSVAMLASVDTTTLASMAVKQQHHHASHTVLMELETLEQLAGG